MLRSNLDILYSLKPGRFHCYSIVKEVSFGEIEEGLGIPGGCQAGWCLGISKATVSLLSRASVRILFSAGREDTPRINLLKTLFVFYMMGVFSLQNPTTPSGSFQDIYHKSDQLLGRRRMIMQVIRWD